MRRQLRLLLISAAVAGGTLALIPSGASADAFNCDATAIQAALLTAPPITIGTANAGQPNCQNANGTALAIPSGLGLPLTANAVQAQTSVSSDQLNATAVGGIGDLGIGLGGSLLSQITGPITQAITGNATPTPIAIGPIPNLLGALLPSSATLSAAQLAASQSAIQASLNNLLANALNGNLLSTGLLTSTATAACVNGQPQLSGSSQLAGLNVLGQNIPLNAPTSQLLNLLNTAQLSQINLASTVNTLTNNIIASLGLTQLAGSNPVLQALIAPTQAALANQIGPQVQAALTPLLTQLQNALNMVLRLTVQPNNQIVGNGQLTQQAVHINLTLNPNGSLGLPSQQLLDLVIGQARISNQSVACGSSGPPGTQTSQAALACSNRNLVLINVLQHGSHTFIEGAARLKFVGKKIPIFFGPKRKQVATATVLPNGFFRTRAPLPPKSIRGTNRARYFAKYGGQTTLRLKFRRRMIVASGTKVSGNTVRITGKVTRPLAKPIAKIIIQRRVTCTSTIDVASIKPKRNGRFSIIAPAPPGAQVGVYRAKTVVRKTTRNPKRYPTFTLPRFVAL